MSMIYEAQIRGSFTGTIPDTMQEWLFQFQGNFEKALAVIDRGIEWGDVKREENPTRIHARAHDVPAAAINSKSPVKRRHEQRDSYNFKRPKHTCTVCGRDHSGGAQAWLLRDHPNAICQPK